MGYLTGVPFSITNTTGRGRDTHVVVDGRDLSPCLQHVTVNIPVSGPVRVDLTPALAVLGTTEDDVPIIGLSGEASAALIAMGWAPPAGER